MSVNPFLLTASSVQDLGWTLIQFLWQGSVIAVLFALLRRSSVLAATAHRRYNLACGALAAMLVAPALTFSMRSQLANASRLTAWPISSASGLEPILPWLVAGWLTGVVFLSIRLIGGWRVAARLRRHGVRPAPREWERKLKDLIATIRVSRPVQLLVSSMVETPTVIGWLRPVVLVPVGALTGLPPAHVEALLAHELAHIRRFDYLVNIVQSVAEALLFYHPAVWWVSGQIRAERELCCDDVAVAACGDVSLYVRALAELESCRPSHEATLAATGGSLLHRIRRLAGQPASVAHALPGAAAAGAMSLLWLLGVGTVMVHGSPAIEESLTVAGVSQRIIITESTTTNGVPSSGNSILSTLLLGPLGPVPQERPATTESPGSIDGTVVGAGSGTPLPGARLELRLPTAQLLAPAAYSTKTDASGKYIFAGVKPGDYRMVVVVDIGGYVMTEFGQTSPNGRGTVFSLAPGQRLQNMQIAMTPSGSIAGRIFDRDGDPVGRAEVQALQPTFVNGKKTLRIVQSIQTNDLGEYRLYWLQPGAYYVTAKPNNPDRRGTTLYVALPGVGGTFDQAGEPTVVIRPLDNGEVGEDVYVPVYYPAALEMRDARTIELRAGQHVGGADINVGAGRLRGLRVRGTLTDSDGKPAANVKVMITPRNPVPSVSVANGVTDSNGRFDIPGVVQGQYTLTAFLGGLGVVTNSNSGPPSRTDAFVPIEVAASNLEGLAVVLRPALTINVRITIEGRPSTLDDPDLARLRVNYRREPDVLGTSPLVLTLNLPGTPSDGTARFYVSPGQYRFLVVGLAANMYVKSMRLGSADLLVDPLLILSQPQGEIEALIGVDAGSIEGRLMNSKRDPVGNTPVVLVPDAPRRQRADLYKVVNSDASGKFQLQGIEPGGYRLFAWEDVVAGAWHDSDFMQLHENRGRAIRVDSNSKGTAEVTIIPRS